MDKQQLIRDIIEIEWFMFSNVKNAGGKASCQMDRETFEIMRISQYMTWSKKLLESYLEDLEQAKAAGRNLMSEKYARMMEYTFPEEYAQLAGRLPAVDDGKKGMVNEIVATHIGWKEALDKQYPHLADRGRPLRSSEDKKYMTPSLETYMRSELLNLSSKTVDLYLQETRNRVRENRSEAEENLLNQVKKYNFNTLEEANAYFANH